MYYDFLVMSRNIWNINLQIPRMSPAGWHIFLGVMRKNIRFKTMSILGRKYIDANSKTRKGRDFLLR